MAEYAALSHGVYCVDACYVEAEVASIYVLRQGDEVAIIETGTYHSLPNLRASLEQLGIADSQVKYVIPTHVHLDHAGGAGAMMRQFEQAQLLIHPRGAAHMIDPTVLVAATIGVYGEEKFARLYGQIEPIPEQRVVIAEDLDCFSLESRQLVFFDTQGHARHHFCIYDETSNGVFTGDTFGVSYQPMKSLARGLIPSTPPSQFDPQALHASITRIMSFDPKRLYLTHYGEFPNPASQVDSFKRWIDEYVALCKAADPSDAEREISLHSAYRQTVLQTLGEISGATDLAGILANDLRLNAQGLAYWWRTAGNG